MDHFATFFKSNFSEISSPLVLGLALHRAWIATFFFSAHNVVSADPSSTHLSSIYTVSLVALTLVLLIGGFFPRAMKRFMWRRPVMVVAPLMMSVGSALLLLAINSGGTLALSVLSGALTGLGSGLMLLYWGEFYGTSNATTAKVHSALAFTLAVFIYTLFLLFSSMVMFVIAGTILPALSGFALMRSLPLSTTEREVHPIPGGDFGMLRVAAAALIISFVHNALIVISLRSSQAAAPPSPLATETLYTLTLLISTFIIATLIFAIIFLSQKSDLGLIYRFVLIFFIIGALFSPFGDMTQTFSSVVLNAGYSCFELIFWIALSNISYRYHIQPLRVFGLGRAGWVIGVFLGGFYPPIPFMESVPATEFAAPFFMVSILIVLIVITYAFILPERSIAAITTGFSSRQGNLQSRCAKLSQQYGLSQRENEVLVYLVKGRNLGFIKEALNISAGTVSTHRQRIYQKTGVHSRQELLDLLEQTRSDEPDRESLATLADKGGQKAKT
ncbi:MAG: helix-turn-helix transcriptional regulator [Coriobacteriales bacterium]|jgi:DNA-binding CsgD family transcriptional regulator|nr:helix-turn-helix transcriptional regulator [Coriobacteriales bacterium]